MYPFMTLHVHFHTVFLITVKIYPSTFLLFCMSTDVPFHHYNCAVYFLFFGITCTVTFQLVYWGTYTQIRPKTNLSVYLHAFLSSNHKDLPVTTTTCVHAYGCTRSWPYLFIFILTITLTAKIYQSTFLLRCMSTFVPVHQYTCSVYFFFFGITCTVTFPLICWGMYTQILMLLLCLRTKTYLSPQLLVYLPLNVPDHDPACSFSYFKYSIWLTARIYPSTFILL